MKVKSVYEIMFIHLDVKLQAKLNPIIEDLNKGVTLELYDKDVAYNYYKSALKEFNFSNSDYEEAIKYGAYKLDI